MMRRIWAIVFLMVGLAMPLPSQAAIFITGSGGGADARIGTITNGKWCSASAGVIVCTEDAPAGAGDVTAVGDCAANDCFDGSAGQGTYLRFYDGNSHYTQIKAGDSTSNLTFTFPTAYPGGASYLLNSTTGGALGFTDPATFATASHNHSSTYVALATYDAHTVLSAATDNTPAALAITEQTVLGRATGGNIAALAIDSDIAGGVSDNDDTVPSAKATKSYADLMVLKSLFDAHTVLYATTDNTPAALAITEQTVLGRATGGNIAALAIDSDLPGGVSASHDTIPSAKATKAYADLMVPKTTYDAYSVLYADTDDTPAALTLAASQFVGRGASGGVAALGLASGGGLTISGTSLSVDIHGTTAETTVADTMELLVWDVSAGALRRMTKGNLFYGVGGGSSPILDLADDGSNESTGLAEIATVNDNAGAAAVFSNPSANKLLVDVSKNWPSASVALTGDSATSFFSTGTLELARGGTGLGTVAVGSILAANSVDTLSAITSASGLKVLQNSAGTISWVTVTGTGSPVLGTAPTFASDVTFSANTANITHSGTTTLAIASTSGTVSVEGITFTGDAVTGASNITSTKLTSTELEYGGNISLDAINAAANSTITFQNSNGTYLANVIVEGDATIQGADLILISATAGAGITAGDGTLTLKGLGSGQDESLIFDFNSTADTITLTSGSLATAINANAFTVSSNGLLPDVADGAALGSTAAEWSDLYLATGGVIYWQNDQSVYLTGGTGTLTLTGAFVTTGAVYPSSANGAALGSATNEWADLFLHDGAIIYGQADQSNTLTSTATGWAANLEFSARSFIPTAAANANGEIGYTANAFSLQADSETATLTASTSGNTWTFASGTGATYAFTPSVALNGGATVATSITPVSNDGAALGNTSLMWSDLFLASGGVINWNNGNATLTHSTGLLSSNVPLAVTGAVYPGAADTYALGSAIAEWSNLFLGDGAIIYGQNDQSATLTSSASKWTANAFDVTGAFSAGAGGMTVDADGDTTVKSLTVSGATGTSGYARVLEDPAYGTNYRGWSMAAATDYTTSWTVNWPGGDPAANQFLFLHAPSGGVISSTLGSFGSEFTVTANTVNLTTGGIGVAKINATGTPSSSTALYGDGSWKAVTAAASGSDGYVQIASSGALSSDAGLAFNATTQRLTIGKSGTTGGLTLLAETGATDYTSTLLPSASAAANLSTTLWASALVAGDTVIASANNQLGVVAKGTAYQIFGMNSGATAPAWTSTLGATGTRLTAGYFTDLAVTNAIVGSVTGNSATVTIADAADDTTTFPLLGTAATGTLAPATDSSLTYNASTGALAATSVTVGTSLLPDAADGAVIGSSSAEWSDIYLADGAVIYGQNDQSATLTSSASTWTANNFGVTTSLVVPNGANPTTDAAGETAVDTSTGAGQGLRVYAADAFTLPAYQTKCTTILAATASSDHMIERFPYAITIRAAHVMQLGATNVIGHFDECDANGANCATIDSTADITATTTMANDDGTLSNPSIDANDVIAWHTTSVSGTNIQTMICFDYTVDQVN